MKRKIPFFTIRTKVQVVPNSKMIYLKGGGTIKKQEPKVA